MPPRGPTLWMQMRRTPSLILWALYVLSIPFYVVPSGLPQPSAVLIFLLVPATLYRWNGRLLRSSIRPFQWLAAFTLWVSFVQVAWAVIMGNFQIGGDSFLIFPFYYLYNVAVFLVVLVLYQKHRDLFLRVTAYTVIAAVTIQVIASFFMRDSSQLRSEVFFNNPNQLGFYALLAACVVAVCQKRVGLGLVKTGLVLLGCAYLALLSASRAAVGGIAILFVVLVFANPRIFIVATIAAGALFVLGGPVDEIVESTQARVEHRRAESLIEGRGYERLWDYKEYAVLGAGEGGIYRFVEKQEHRIEIHSSAGTILFSYGLVGVGLFLAFLWSTLRGARLRLAVMVLPSLSYTIAHQGLRFTSLWLLLALFVAVKHQTGEPAEGSPAVGRLGLPGGRT